MSAANFIRAVGVALLVFVVQGLAFGGFSRGTADVTTAAFLLGTAGGMLGIGLILGADWFAERVWDRPGATSLSMERHERNRRARARAFRAHVRAGGFLPEPPEGVGHDPDVLEAWVGGDYDRTERLVEMRAQEAARLPETSPEAIRSAHYREMWEAAAAAIEKTAPVDPRTSSILDEAE